MVLENNQDNAEAVQTSESCAAKTSDFIKTTPAVSAGATVARSASARFPRPMVFPCLRDKPMSNSLDKILAEVSTQLIQKETRMIILQCRCKCSKNSKRKFNSNRT